MLVIKISFVFLLFLLPSSFSEIQIEPVVEMRWDFTDCEQSGRFGPSQEQCDQSYKDTNLEGEVEITKGIQEWTVPMTGLYLITAMGASGVSPSGISGGRGAVITADFQLQQGEKLNLLIGQQSDYNPLSGSQIGPGGSGGSFVTRMRDDHVLIIAGGGGCGAGKSPDLSKRSQADASLNKSGKNASKTFGEYGTGGLNGNGGFRGYILGNQISTSGGGAGYFGDGNFSFVKPGELSDVESPSPAIRFTSKGFSDRAPGTGGFFMFILSESVIENNGGFGGGGSGSFDGGAGGGGGYSGGGGGPYNGWGGGGGSLNNGKRPIESSLKYGRGSITISYTGKACCGPVIVYIAACLIAGILVTVLFLYAIHKLRIYIKNKRKDSSSDWKKASKFISISSNKRKKRDAHFKESSFTNPSLDTQTETIERKEFYRPGRRSYK